MKIEHWKAIDIIKEWILINRLLSIALNNR